MAIVKMNKITVIGFANQKENILEKLMRLGVVEVSNIEQDASNEEWSKLVSGDGDETSVSRIESDLARVRSSIEYINKYSVQKKGLFESKRVIELDKYNKIIKNQDTIWSVVEQIDSYDSSLGSLRAEENRLRNLIESLTPWKPLDIPLDVASTRKTSVLTGVVPATIDDEKLKQSMFEAVKECCINIINADKEQKYLLAIYHTSVEEEVMSQLKQFGFAKVAFKDLTGTVDYNIRECSARIDAIEKERQEIQRNIANLVGEKHNLEILYDHLEILKDKKKILNKLVRTDKTFMLEGWLPAELSEKVESEITANSDCIVDIRQPGEDEDYPILLKNNSLVQPFEIITELYSLPSSKGIDPNPFMAPFYFVFFGMMVSDAGYGLLLALVTGIVLWKFKLEGMAYKLIKMIFFGGISTFIWGALFGGWFGNIVDVVTSGEFTVPPIWFNPLDDPMRLLLWSFIFGGIHIFVGMGLNAYMMIRDGKPLDALFDVGSWYLLLIGIVMLVGGGFVADVGKYMAIVGALMLVLTQGRNEKNIVKRLVSGVLSLYNITSYLSDVLSYSRLLALGLATGVIATVINTMGSLFGLDNIGGIILLAVALIVGTVFNILINALGAYVHASRLQYVEFFGKFYEGGGKGFEPFKIKTKYINLNDRRQN
jgi:V/A-type H+-transporting ATPase subunit I